MAPGAEEDSGSGSEKRQVPAHAWLVWGWGGALLLLAVLLLEPFPPGIWHDDGVYVLLGRSLADGQGLHYLSVPGAPPAPKFPPVYPLVLAALWKLVPGFPANAAVFEAANLALLALAGVLFLSFLRRALGVPSKAALAISALAWSAPHLWQTGLVPLSEPLFLVFLLTALGAGSRLRGQPSGRALAGFLVLAGLAAYTRTLGAVLFLAGAAALAVRGSRRRALGVVLAGAVLLLPWVVWGALASRRIPPPLADTLGPYGSWWLREATADPGAFLGFLASNGPDLARRVAELLLPGLQGSGLWLGALVLLPPLVAGCKALWEEAPIVPLTLLLSLFVLLFWPFQDVRLVVPFQPLLVLAAAAGFLALARTWGKGSPMRVGVGVVGLSWALLVLSVSAERLATGWPAERYRLRSAALSSAVRAVAEKTPPDAVVGAPELWSGIYLFTGRASVPSARFLPLARSGPSWGTPEQQYELWLATGVTHILVEHGGGVHGEALDRVDAVCPPGTVQVLDMQPGQFLVALAWDEECRRRLLDTAFVPPNAEDISSFTLREGRSRSAGRGSPGLAGPGDPAHGD